MRLKHFAFALAACAALALMPTTTRADSLSLTLNPFFYVGQSGGKRHFDGYLHQRRWRHSLGWLSTKQ